MKSKVIISISDYFDLEGKTYLEKCKIIEEKYPNTIAWMEKKK